MLEDIVTYRTLSQDIIGQDRNFEELLGLKDLSAPNFLLTTVLGTTQ
jgi:hypothetical protein